VRKTLQAFRKMSSFLLIAGVDISGGNGNGQKRRKSLTKAKERAANGTLLLF